MGVFSRFKDIVNANINALLDKAEDPEKMLKLERKISEQQALVSRWQSRARMAIDRNRDDLAREALIEKRKENETLSSLMSDLGSYDAMIKESRDEIGQLEAKLTQARGKLKMLQEKQKAAKESDALNRGMNRNTDIHFDNLESRIDRLNAQSELNRHAPSADETFRSMEEMEEIERELEELKKGKKE